MNQVIFALFSKPPALDPASIAFSLAARHPGRKIAGRADEDDIFTIDIDVVAVIVSMVSAPIPGDDISSVDEFSRRGWPDSGDAAESHTLHAVVVATGTSDAKALSSALTIVAAELCRGDACLGVYWGPSGVLAHKSALLDADTDVAEGGAAISLWINAHPYQNEAGVGMTTEGLAVFIGRELHFLPHTSHELDDLFERTLNFAAYLYDKGAVVKDGESLGYSAMDVFRARWTDEPTPEGETIPWIELRLEAAPRP